MTTLSPLSPSPALQIQDVQQEINFNALVHQIINIIGESTWSSKKILFALFKLNRELNQETTQNQASSLRSWMPTGLKTLSCAFKVMEIATAIPQTGCVLSALTGQCMTADQMTKIFEQVLQPAEGLANAGASYFESHGQAERTEDSNRGETYRSEAEYASRKKGEADAEFNEILRMASGIKDAQRSTLSAISATQR